MKYEIFLRKGTEGGKKEGEGEGEGDMEEERERILETMDLFHENVVFIHTARIYGVLPLSVSS